MNISDSHIHDVVGVGFGPANLSLAISLEEHPANVLTAPVTAAFFERQPSFGWHRNMLLPASTMQISFLKDLVTFRNPVSRFSFVSFLHAHGRLAQFVNRKDFFPTRREFHQYLEWAAAAMSNVVSYGASVTAIRCPELGPVDHVQLEVRQDGGTRLVNARNVVISTGLQPRMPAGVVSDDRVWHSSEFLGRFGRIDAGRLTRVAVVGAGQSAAELTKFLYDRVPHAQVYGILPSYGYSVADDTPFANQVFDAAAVNDYYFGDQPARDAFWRYHRNTNYGVVDSADISELYRITYDEHVAGACRLHVRNLTKVQAVERRGQTVRLTLKSSRDTEPARLDVDLIVFATGYDSMDPTGLLGELDQFCLRDATGRHRVTRDYRLITTPRVTCGIYLQGGTEHTHGLTSSLLSNIAVRSGEIVDSIVRRRAERESLNATVLEGAE